MRVCINICKNQIRFRNRHSQSSILEGEIIELICYPVFTD